ncbi:MAG: transposase [Candidatus Thiodiazotropha sp. (ex Lucinoma aequizonata)]|nr:transposase [Candidatus Thiodiazotropha sp. (ex Lucinoma aequizonata)]MCU7889770.1 transposase [Candidatus Thiodiazotropha sp. (ex Lucinoma aequizonata)]MCU7896580.1 transposase [Candidatus Thiodiazotropha sp. (ex Lucinoma aequizonata)]MCU7901695.1 transposase [Candidatus Thiodiazotropha sp. (ex Lucinoma aequizonata)]MCU7910389.1 transposase [Candidatus Thiodiazotropha sp. (ex Lucinoma aequizonata)]
MPSLPFPWRSAFDWRWPRGFVCPECGHTHHCLLNTNQLYQCYHCHHQASLTNGTIFADTKLPLTTWFLSMFLVTQIKNGISALELMRHLGVSYGSVWSIKHKLMQVMKERERMVSHWTASSKWMMLIGEVNAMVESVVEVHLTRYLSLQRSLQMRKIIQSLCDSVN